MQSHQLSPPEPSLDDLAAAADDLAGRIDAAACADRVDRDADGLGAAALLLRAVDRLIAAVITVLQTAPHHQVVADHGLTRDTWLRAVARRTGADAGMLLAAAERLTDMPAVSAWFHRGVLSWGAVRAIVASTRNLTAAQRTWVDTALADHAGDVARLDGDQVAAAVDGLVHQARPDLHRDAEASTLSRRWLSIQPRLDGTADIHGTLDPETTAVTLAAFSALTGHHNTDDDGDRGDGDAGAGMSDADHARSTKRRANVDIFGDLCRQRLSRHGPGGTGATDSGAAESPDTDDVAADTAEDPEEEHAADGASDGPAAARGFRSATTDGWCSWCGAAPSTARPAFLVVADLAALDPDAPVGSGTARLHWATNRAPVELTPAAAQRLACDATLRVVVTDGTTVLGVTAAYPKVSATLHAALVVRDGGCRFPGCHQPVERCDAHHVLPVAANGPTTLENLALICRDHHHAIHDSGWQVVLHTDGMMTFARRGVTLTSQPRARQHPRPAQPPPSGRPRRHRATRSTSGQPPVLEPPGGAKDLAPDTVTEVAGHAQHSDRDAVGELPF